MVRLSCKIDNEMVDHGRSMCKNLIAASKFDAPTMALLSSATCMAPKKQRATCQCAPFPQQVGRPTSSSCQPRCGSKSHDENPRVNIPKDVENTGFPQENTLQMIDFPHLC